MSKFFILIFGFLLSSWVHADEYNLFSGDLLDFELGPGYGGGENYRVNGSRRKYQGGGGHGIVPFYHFKIGPIYISDVYSLDVFKHSDKDARFRLGGLITYTGEPYQAGAIKKFESIFGGAFIGYGSLTIYGITDLMGKSNGTIYGIRYAPLIIKNK